MSSKVAGKNPGSGKDVRAKQGSPPQTNKGAHRKGKNSDGPKQSIKTLVDQLKDGQAKAAAEGDLRKEDRVTLAALKAKEELANFQNRANIRDVLEQSAATKDLALAEESMLRAQVRAQETASSTRRQLVEAVEASSVSHLLLAEQISSTFPRFESSIKHLELQTQLLKAEAGHSAVPISTAISGCSLAAELIMAESRLRDIRVSKTEPTNMAAQEHWNELFRNIRIETKATGIAVSPGIGAMASSFFGFFVDPPATCPAEESHVYNKAVSHAQLLDRLVDLGRTTNSFDVFSSEFKEAQDEVESLWSDRILKDCSSKHCLADDVGQLLSILEPVTLCELPVSSYDPFECPGQAFTSSVRDEIQMRLGDRFNTAATVAFTGPALSLTFGRLGRAFVSSASNAWYNLKNAGLSS